MGDDEIRAALGRGDLRTLHRLLVAEHYRAVFDRCLAICRVRSTAEDAAQNTFLKVLERPDQLHSVGSYRAWLLSVATTTTIDLLRSSQRHRDRADRYHQSAVANEDTVMPPPASEAQRVAAAIQACLAELALETRAAFLRRHQDDASWADIAREVNLEVDAVRMRVRRAEREIEARLRALGIEP